MDGIFLFCLLLFLSNYFIAFIIRIAEWRICVSVYGRHSVDLSICAFKSHDLNSISCAPQNEEPLDALLHMWRSCYWHTFDEPFFAYQNEKKKVLSNRNAICVAQTTNACYYCKGQKRKQKYSQCNCISKLFKTCQSIIKSAVLPRYSATHKYWIYICWCAESIEIYIYMNYTRDTKSFRMCFHSGSVVYRIYIHHST